MRSSQIEIETPHMEESLVSSEAHVASGSCPMLFGSPDPSLLRLSILRIQTPAVLPGSHALLIRPPPGPRGSAASWGLGQSRSAPAAPWTGRRALRKARLTCAAACDPR